MVRNKLHLVKTIQINNSGTNNPTNNTPSNSKKTIVIDAGHDYGRDYGAESTIDGVTYSETVLNIQVASKLQTELENRGYNVVMTRNAGEEAIIWFINGKSYT